MDCTEEELLSDLERARRELSKLGVALKDSLHDRVHRALIDLPPRLGRPAELADLRAEFPDELPHRVRDALLYLAHHRRALNPRRGMWVAVTESAV